jgi:hypothetical protein
MQSMQTIQQTENSGGGSPRSPWRWGVQQQRGAIRNGPTRSASAIPDGTYVSARGGGGALFRVQNGRRQPIEPPSVESMGITQNNIREVDPLVLSAMPLEVTRRRAAGRDIQGHLWSDLKAGHFMESWVYLVGNRVDIQTRTETVTWFGGYSGGVQVVFYDANGKRILHDPIRYRYGVDGRAFGPGWREVPETLELPQNVADAAEVIFIAHYWDPKVDLVAIAIEVGQTLAETLKTLLEAQQQGEPINAGGDQS